MMGQMLCHGNTHGNTQPRIGDACPRTCKAGQHVMGQMLCCIAQQLTHSTAYDRVRGCTTLGPQAKSVIQQVHLIGSRISSRNACLYIGGCKLPFPTPQAAATSRNQHGINLSQNPAHPSSQQRRAGHSLPPGGNRHLRKFGQRRTPRTRRPPPRRARNQSRRRSCIYPQTEVIRAIMSEGGPHLLHGLCGAQAAR